MKTTHYFAGDVFPSGFYWFNEAPEYTFDRGLRLHTRGDTDFWQRTHYGFQRDDGHCLFTRLGGDFVMTCHVAFEPCTQYDQCGLMVRVDPEHWIKLSTEYEDETLSRLGSVVTNAGWSDWATQDVDSSIRQRWYRITRERDDFTLESSEDGTLWRQMRITHLHNAHQSLEAGIYACSPQGNGFYCTFHSFAIGQ